MIILSLIVRGLVQAVLLPFGIDVSLIKMWNWVINKLSTKLEYCNSQDLSLFAKVQVAGNIINSMHIYLTSLWMPSKVGFNIMKTLLWDFLWDNESTKNGLNLVAWNFCTRSSSEG